MKSNRHRQPDSDPDALEMFHRQSRSKQAARKSKQLCSQVMRTLSLCLGGECGDPLLQDLLVIAVTPAPDASRVRVELICPAAANPAEVLDRLSRVYGLLRRSVAADIVRKRAPELIFHVIPAGEAPHE